MLRPPKASLRILEISLKARSAFLSCAINLRNGALASMRSFRTSPARRARSTALSNVTASSAFWHRLSAASAACGTRRTTGASADLRCFFIVFSLSLSLSLSLSV